MLDAQGTGSILGRLSPGGLYAESTREEFGVRRHPVFARAHGEE